MREVRWVRDTTGRFDRRPFYPQAYLDEWCERILSEFLNELYGQVTVPVPSGAIIKLIERDARELNVYADLRPGILGVTDFDPPRKPVVRIARDLFVESRQLNRLRFTLMHEYAHIKLHAPLFARVGSARREDHECKVDEIEPAEQVVDWMEWQAGYAAGALLMPTTRVQLVIQACLGPSGDLQVPVSSPRANDLKQRLSEAFAVSGEAAWIRLTQLGYLRN